MLETPEERVELLRAGLSGRTIEKLYLVYNGIKIVHSPILFDIQGINIKENEDPAIIQSQTPGKEQYAVC